jgi:hypothetical protein
MGHHQGSAMAHSQASLRTNRPFVVQLRAPPQGPRQPMTPGASLWSRAGLNCPKQSLESVNHRRPRSLLTEAAVVFALSSPEWRCLV